MNTILDSISGYSLVLNILIPTYFGIPFWGFHYLFYIYIYIYISKYDID